MAAMSEKSKSYITGIITILSAAIVLFHIYTTLTFPLQSLQQRSVHYGFMLVIIFLYLAIESKHMIIRLIYYLIALLSVAINLYNFIDYENMMMRTTRLLPLDYVFGLSIIAITLFIAYKYIGIWMPLIAVLFIGYAYLSPRLPGLLYYSGISLRRFVASLYIGFEGIYGDCMGVSATIVVMFLFFGEVLVEYGAGQFVIDIASVAFGGLRGGPGKVAVIASSLFGMVSGNATANVVGTGTITIPLMKNTGFSPEYAGAVECTASTGGLIMPPVMGAAAFIMAEILGIEYGKVCLYALIPALLYYFCCFLMVDLHSAKCNLRGLSKDQMPNGRTVLKEGWHFGLAIMLLVFLLCVLQWSASKSALYAALCVIVTEYFKQIVIMRKKYSLTQELKRFVGVLTQTAKSCLPVVAACACAGVIVGVLNATSLTMRFSSILVQAASGSLPLLLVLAMIGCIVLGMGLPAISVYIITAVIVAPALIQLGVNSVAAHMFVFYFGIMAPITPPVGVAFYVAAGIAKANPMKTGFQAWLLALPGFILPFVFVYQPALLLQGSIATSLWTVFTCIIGIVALAAALEGYLFRKIPMAVRAILIVCALLAIIPETITDLISLPIFFGCTAYLLITAKRAKVIAAK